MKAFRFRLDQARRYRDAQLTLQKAKVAQAVARAAITRQNVEAAANAISQGAADARQAPSGSTLAAYADYSAQAIRRLPALQKQDAEAHRAVAGEMARLLEAKRRAQLLENLRDTERERWQREFDRETAAFVDETFLSRLNLKRNTGA